MNQPPPFDSLVQGTATPAFESLRRLFAQQMSILAEESAQLCVYVRGEKVVDLWASPGQDPEFGPDSLVNVFSSSKSLEAIAVASLVGRGLLSYDAKVSEYWPEFRGSGKEDVLVCDVMRHEAGLANFDTAIDVDDLLPENIKANRIGSLIEAQPRRFRDNSQGKREYHAITRGWIVNELFRRADPAGRTIGEYLREEVSGPLGADVAVGLDEAKLPRASEIKLLAPLSHIFASFRPKIFRRRVFHNAFQLMVRLFRIMRAMGRGRDRSAPPPINEMLDIHFFNDTRMRMGETPSANAHCSARGLARVAAMMAGGGTLDGVTCLETPAWQALHQHPEQALMGGVLPTRFTQGGVDQFLPSGAASPLLERAFNDGREGFYGWMGLGGSIFQWHPQAAIGFAFVPTSLHLLDFFNERGKIYQAEVLRCIAAGVSNN